MGCISTGNHILTIDKSSWILGQWNAYVAAGNSREDRRKRFQEVPDKYREAVRSHVRTVNQILNRKE